MTWNLKKSSMPLSDLTTWEKHRYAQKSSQFYSKDLAAASKRSAQVIFLCLFKWLIRTHTYRNRYNLEILSPVELILF